MPALAANAPTQEPEDRGARHLQEVLRSECFKRASALRSLLVYLWENRLNEISEYAIAVEALGRSPNFESKVDASVRVQISRLRQFLARYYESEGRHAAERLVIPVGTHQLQLVQALPEGADEEPDPEAEIHPGVSGDPLVASSRPDFLVPLLSGIIVLLVFCLGWLLWPSLHNGNRPALAAKQELPLFWRGFLDNGKPTRIVLPTPIFFTWGPPENQRVLMARDVSVNDFNKLQPSSEIAVLEKKLGKPRPWRNYTVASDTFASLRLARFFDSYGVRSSISSADESPRGIIDHENIIVFGTPSSMADFQPDIERLSFQLAPYPFERYVLDKHLPPGSPGEFPAVQESASRTVAPGIIALLPRGSEGGRILIVQGLQTMALISYLISEEGMSEISRAQAQHGNYPYFEAVILSEVNAGNPIQSRMVAYRPFKGTSTSNQIADAFPSPTAPTQDFFIGSGSH